MSADDQGSGQLGTDSAEDVIVVRQVGLAVLAAVDARRVEVDVVGETHDCDRRGSESRS